MNCGHSFNMESRVDTTIHILLVSLPAQGHINPILRLGKRLASEGLKITFCTTENFGKKLLQLNGMKETQIGYGSLRFEFFDDGCTEGFPNIGQFELAGKKAIPLLIKKLEEKGSPVSFIIHNNLISWISEVASKLNIPCAVLWTNACAVFSAYYHYHHKLVAFPTENEPHLGVQLPSLPLLKHDEIPSFMHPATRVPLLHDAFLTQIRNLDKEVCVLMETFYELEKPVIEDMSKICDIKPVGPLVKIVEKQGISTHTDDESIAWLDSKPVSSVLYVSFGSLANVEKDQVEEIALALLNSGLNFLWTSASKLQKIPNCFLEKAGDKGKVVQWCNQEQVLAHPSLACFLSHCGWNSAIEALACGVPVVTFPMYGDQVTDAKLLVDVFGVGVKACEGVSANRLVTRGQIEVSLQEATKGDKAHELKTNGQKWKKAAEDAVALGGSTQRYFQEFVDVIKKTFVKKNVGH